MAVWSDGFSTAFEKAGGSAGAGSVGVGFERRVLLTEEAITALASGRSTYSPTPAISAQVFQMGEGFDRCPIGVNCRAAAFGISASVEGRTVPRSSTISGVRFSRESRNRALGVLLSS